MTLAAAAAMCSNNNNGAVFRGAAGGGSLCSIPEDGDLVSFATQVAAESESRDDLWIPMPSSSSSAESGERGPRRRREGRGRCDAPPADEQRVFHRSPVSLDNGYKPAVLVDMRTSPPLSRSPSASEDLTLEERDTPPGRESLYRAKTIVCLVLPVLGAIVGVGAALFAVAVGILLLRDALWS